MKGGGDSAWRKGRSRKQGEYNCLPFEHRKGKESRGGGSWLEKKGGSLSAEEGLRAKKNFGYTWGTDDEIEKG